MFMMTTLNYVYHSNEKPRPLVLVAILHTQWIYSFLLLELCDTFVFYFGHACMYD